jgi:hypothetical protein
LCGGPRAPRDQASSVSKVKGDRVIVIGRAVTVLDGVPRINGQPQLGQIPERASPDQLTRAGRSDMNRT